MYNNYIVAYPPVRSFTGYLHLRKNGLAFNEGDRVEKGQVIAWNGNAGYSSGLRVHIPVFSPRPKKKKASKPNPG